MKVFLKVLVKDTFKRLYSKGFPEGFRMKVFLKVLVKDTSRGCIVKDFLKVFE